jgi:hypothetical protein
MITTIPNLHVSTTAGVKGSGKVNIMRRKDASHSGIFGIKLGVQFNPAVDNYPSGSMEITTDLTDSFKGIFTSTSIELINSLGRDTPSIFLTGRCDVKRSEQSEIQKGCKYWVMISDNKKVNDKGGTPDIVGFVVHDRNGSLIAYGTGPVISGDIVVIPS